MFVFNITCFRMVTEDRHLAGVVRLSDWFNRPLLVELENAFDDLTRGLTYQPMGYSDQFWDSEITQFLFKWDLFLFILKVTYYYNNGTRFNFSFKTFSLNTYLNRQFSILVPIRGMNNLNLTLYFCFPLYPFSSKEWKSTDE